MHRLNRITGAATGVAAFFAIAFIMAWCAVLVGLPAAAIYYLVTH